MNPALLISPGNLHGTEVVSQILKSVVGFTQILQSSCSRPASQPTLKTLKFLGRFWCIYPFIIQLFCIEKISSVPGHRGGFNALCCMEMYVKKTVSNNL